MSTQSDEQGMVKLNIALVKRDMSLCQNPPK